MAAALITLNEFVAEEDLQYRKKMSVIPLFDVAQTAEFSKFQKQKFVKIFYHVRGHFHDFLWLMGSFSPDLKTKNIVLKNIGEEFGGVKNSHEQLYIDFAKALDIDIEEEIISEKNYLDFARQFNKGHIEWLLKHNWHEKLAAFSAYEHLDNIDYPFLFNLAKSFNLSDKQMLFFKVHMKVQHYEATRDLLNEIWEKDLQSVQNGFRFIFNHQLAMWHKLSSLIYNDSH